MQDLHDDLHDNYDADVSSSLVMSPPLSEETTCHDEDNDGDVSLSTPVASVLVTASDVEEKMVSLASDQEESTHHDVSTTQEEGTSITLISSSTWQQLGRSMRSEILQEGKSEMWREHWLGVHLPPSAVARGAHDDMLDEDGVSDSSFYAEEAANSDQEELVDTLEEVILEEEEPPSPPPPPAAAKPSLPTVTTPPEENNAQRLPPSSIPTTTTTTTPITLYSLLTSPPSGPSIPLYPLLLLLTTTYTLKQTLHCLFGFKSRTRLNRSVQRVLWKERQFVIPKDQLLQHIEWMKVRNDLRRLRERNRRMQERNGGGYYLEDGDGSGDGGGDGGGMSSSFGRGSGSSSGRGGYQNDSNNDSSGNDNDDGYDDNRHGENYTYQNGNLSLEDEKENIHQSIVNWEELQYSMRGVGQLDYDDACTNETTTVQLERSEKVAKKDDNHENANNNLVTTERETCQKYTGDQEKLPISMGNLEQLKADDLCATDKILILKEMISEAMEKKDGEIALLKSKIELNEQVIEESNEKASTFERQCNDLKEQTALLKQEIADLELVCERMYTSGVRKDELEGLEIEGTSSHSGSLTTLDNDNEDDSMASTDSEWDRMTEENELLRTENDLLKESLECVRKELDEARADAATLSKEMKDANTQRETSTENDVTVEMTDESFECMGSSDYEGTDCVKDNVLSSPTRSVELTNAIQLLLKYAYGTSPPKENNNPNQDLNQDLLQLMTILRKLDGDQSIEKGKSNSSTRKDSVTKDREVNGKGHSRHRAGTKERLKILAKSRFKRIREKS